MWYKENVWWRLRHKNTNTNRSISFLFDQNRKNDVILISVFLSKTNSIWMNTQFNNNNNKRKWCTQNIYYDFVRECVWECASVYAPNIQISCTQREQPKKHAHNILFQAGFFPRLSFASLDVTFMENAIWFYNILCVRLAYSIQI